MLWTTADAAVLLSRCSITNHHACFRSRELHHWRNVVVDTRRGFNTSERAPTASRLCPWLKARWVVRGLSPRPPVVATKLGGASSLAVIAPGGVGLAGLAARLIRSVRLGTLGETIVQRVRPGNLQCLLMPPREGKSAVTKRTP